MQALFLGFTALLGLSLANTVSAQAASTQHASKLSATDRAFISQAEPSIAITQVGLIDGSGSAPRKGMTVLFADGRITAVGPAERIRVPSTATVIDGAGKTLLPGFVFMHEHLFYPTDEHGFRNYPEQFTRLYLASGVTTIRTGAALDARADLAIASAIASGRQVGPDIDVTSPYIEGQPKDPSTMPLVIGPDKVRKLVDYWADEGVTSYKVYEYIRRADFRAAIDAAHARGLKVTGHICSITYEEAAVAGIDNIEHSFMMPSDFVAGKKPDECPSWEERLRTLMKLDPQGPQMQRLIRLLVDRRVALTSTLPVIEPMIRGRRPRDEDLAPLSPRLRDIFNETWKESQSDELTSLLTDFLPKLMQFERAFLAAGGLLMAGSDPTGIGGVLPGAASQRQLHMMLDGGFRLPEAIRVMTLNAATYLGRERDIGSVAVGKRADLVLLNGDLLTDANAIDRITIVFKNGVGYDPVAIKKALAGTVGLE